MEDLGITAIDIPIESIPSVWDFFDNWERVLYTLMLILVAVLLNRVARWLFRVDSPLFDSEIDGYRSAASVKGTLLSPLIIWSLTWLSAVGIIWDANLAVVLATLGPVLLGVGFALRSIIGNLFAGLISLFDGAYTEGELIELNDGSVGTVRKVGLFSTDIHTHSKIISVPNDTLKSEPVVNYDHRPGSRSAPILIGIDDARWGDNSVRSADRINTRTVGRLIDKILGGGKFDITHDRFGKKLDEPRVADWAWHEIHGDAIVFSARVWSNSPLDEYATRGRFLRIIMEAFDEKGWSYGYTTYLGSKNWSAYKSEKDPFDFS